MKWSCSSLHSGQGREGSDSYGCGGGGGGDGEGGSGYLFGDGFGGGVEFRLLDVCGVVFL